MVFSIKKWRSNAIKLYGKTRGLTKPQRDHVTRVTHGASAPATKRSSPSASKKPRKVKRRMTKRKRRRSSGISIPLAPIAGLAAGLGEPIARVISGDYDGAIVLLGRHYTGFDSKSGTFQPNYLKKGLLPLIAGLLVHKFVGGTPLNLNRVLARAKVPFIRI